MRPNVSYRAGGHAPGPEKQLELLVRRSLAARWKGRHQVHKYHGDEYSEVGMPDLFGHVEGRYYGLELKVAHGYFTDGQKQALMATYESGACAAGLLGFKSTLQQPASYWLLPAPIVMQFSYKDKRSWLPLLVVERGGLTYLNLTPLEVFLARP